MSRSNEIAWGVFKGLVLFSLLAGAIGLAWGLYQESEREYQRAKEAAYGRP